MTVHTRNALRALAVVLAIVAISYVAGRHVLHEYAARLAAAEQAGAAWQHLARVERILSDAVAALRALEQRGSRSCAPMDRLAYIEAATALPFVRRIGPVGDGGEPLCLEPQFEPVPALRLAPRRDGQRRITLVVSPTGVDGQVPVAPLVLAWDGGEVRHVAELLPEAFSFDGGAEFLRAAMSSEVTIDGRAVWSRRAEADPPGEHGERDLSVVRARSSVFPLEVRADMPTAAAMAIVASLETILLVGAIASAFVLTGVVVALYWRPRADAETEFAAAVARGEFIPYYQPVVNIVTGRLEGCEVLVRWQRRDGTIVSPGQFMQYAETSGDVFEITRQLMVKVSIEIGPLYRSERQLKASVNLFAGHFDDTRIVDDVRRVFDGGAIAYDQLVFEVTERLPLRNVDAARAIMEELKALGCRIALDDTGCGHSGLATIQQLPFDIIKIDKMFVDSMDLDENSSRIVDVLVGLAKSFRLGLIAEGVEREEQVTRLRAMGVTAAQGYFFAPPLPGRAFLDLAGALLAKGPDRLAEGDIAGLHGGRAAA